MSECGRGSVNRSLLEGLYGYPMGNGLGGGGTSLPYFLMGLVRNPIAVENEYARILLEQGIIGLLIWIAFISWIVFNGKAFLRTKWSVSRRLSFALVVVYFGASNIELGMLTAIPGSFIFFLLIGWIVTKPDNSDDALAKVTRPGRYAVGDPIHTRVFPSAVPIANA